MLSVILQGGVAHDFNNQLTGVLGYAELLSISIDDPALKKYAENICLAAKRSSDLTKNLLTFSRKGKYRNEKVNINKLISETAELLLRSVNKKITIHQDLNARCSVISGDPSQLQNALLNLGINSADAMPDGGVLTFKTEIILIDKQADNHFNQIVEAGSYLKITVSDNGSGIPYDEQVHIFEPFFTTKTKGTGMGLSSVYGAVKQHNGSITFESETDKGTKFYIYLPFAGEKNEEKNISAKSDHNKISLNFLVVDDEDSIRELVCEMLLLSGHNVTTCSNGREAVDVYKEKWKEIDIVIIDMIMPEMDGRDSFRAMKIENPEIKVILSTGYSDDKNTRCLIEEGVLDIINKPFNLSRLLDVIGRITDNTPIIS